MEGDKSVGINKDWPIMLIVFIGIGFLIFWLSSGSPIGNLDTTPTPKIILTLYTTGPTNVRSCSSLKCKIVGVYPKNSTFDITTGPYAGITSISQLPEWAAFTWIDNGKSVTGYISRNLLSDQYTPDATTAALPADTSQPVATINDNSQVRQQPPSAPLSLSATVKEWSPRIVRIYCSDNNYTSTGSGVLTRMTFSNINVVNAPTLITNKHVVTDPISGYAYTACNFQTADTNGIYNLNMTSERTLDNQDVAYFPSSTTNVPSGASVGMKVCQSTDVEIGDDIITLGYPVSGGTGNASRAITVSQGIISSFDGEFYVTDAKIDHGNSGGAAILLKNDCYLGIPTWVQAQSNGFESYGRILDAQYIFSN